MCKIKLTLDTKDRDALEAVSDLCLTLANRVPTLPGSNVVELYPEAKAGVEPPPQTYDVDGRQYTAEGIRAGGFTIEQLYSAGFTVTEISSILQKLPSLVEATVLALPPEECTQHLAEPEPVPEPEPRTTGVELDSADMPWDMRIHSGNKSKISDGTWKKKRGVDKAIVEEVEAELVALMSAGARDVGAVEPNPYDDLAPPVLTDATPDHVVLEPKSSLVPPPPVAEPETPDGGAMSFPQFLKACSVKINGGDGVTMDQILSVLNRHSVASLQLVRNREDLIPQIWADIDAGLFDE